MKFIIKGYYLTFVLTCFTFGLHFYEDIYGHLSYFYKYFL